MANRRSRAAAATGDKPAAKPASRRAAAVEQPSAPAAAQGTDDEHDLEPDGGEADGDDAPGISLSASDFRNNPRVIDMAAEVEGEPGEEFSGTASDDSDDEDDDEPPVKARRSSKAAAAAPARGGRVRVRLVGLRSAKKARPPYGVSIVVPAVDAEDQDPGYDGVHSEGETVQFTRGRSVSVSRRAATWLKGHPEFIVEEA